VCHFYQYKPFLFDDVLHIKNFGALIVHFIRLETCFCANSSFKYDLFCVLLYPNESVFWIWLSRVQIFEGPKSVCHFYQYGPTLSDGVLHIMNFCAPIVHFIRLETWFYSNSTFKFHFLLLFLVPKWVCLLNLALASSNFEETRPCAISISTGHFYLMVYFILRILVPI